MLRHTALIALALVPFTPAAAASAPVAGQADGMKFEYTTQVATGGKVVLGGRFLDTSEDFTFVVEKDGYVHGAVADRAVAFTISRKQHDRLMSEVAKDTAVAVADASGN